MRVRWGAAEGGREGWLRLPESGVSLGEVEKELMERAGERGKQNKAVAAKLLNVTYQSLRYQIRKFGLE